MAVSKAVKIPDLVESTGVEGVPHRSQVNNNGDPNGTLSVSERLWEAMSPGDAMMMAGVGTGQ